MNCPLCGSKVIYQGLSNVECEGYGCENGQRLIARTIKSHSMGLSGWTVTFTDGSSFFVKDGTSEFDAVLELWRRLVWRSNTEGTGTTMLFDANNRLQAWQAEGRTVWRDEKDRS